MSTDSEFTFPCDFEYLSSTDPSEESLSEREIRKRTDPELMAPFLGPELQLQAVKDLRALVHVNLLETYTKNSMSYLLNTIDIEKRMSPDKAERANQEVRNLLALGMIQPSLCPCPSGIVMGKKKHGELRF